MHGPSKLHQLARRHGVDTRYLDIEGIERAAPDSSLRAVLGALGVSVHDDASVERALRQDDRNRWSTPLPPVTVAWDGRARLYLRLPAHSPRGGFAVVIETEDGGVLRSDGQLDELDLEKTVDVEGTTYVAMHVPVPGPLPIGYHEVRVELPGGAVARTLVFSAPRRVFVPTEPSARSTWGLFVPLYALHTQRSLGAADFTDLRELIAWVAAQGGSVVGTLPLLAAFLGDPCMPSPYAPVSRLAWNELYLDVRSLPEFAASSSAREAARGPVAQKVVGRLRAAEQVDYETLARLQREALEPMAVQLWEAGGARRQQMRVFERTRPEIADYARFRAVHERLRAPWQTWPGRLQEGDVRDGDFDPVAYRYHLYAQWNVHEQLAVLAREARGGGLGLYLDLPVGVLSDGYDVWRHRDAFARDLSTGAPPDALFARGQDWGFPPLHPERLRADRYRYFIAVIRNHLRYAGVLRIDHVMGLHRLYTVPRGATAKQGVYVRYRDEEMYALLSIESHRAGAVLLGENLGTVPPEVTRSMAEHGVHGMHVVQYAAQPDPDRALPPPEEGEVASLNTHDMPPFASFWQGLDIEQRHRLGWLDEAEVQADHLQRAGLRRALTRFFKRDGSLPDEPAASEVLPAALRHLGRSDARMVLVNLEDLWGETQAQNVPGTTDEHPNWCHRNRYAFELWRTMPEVQDNLRILDRARRGARDRSLVRHDVSQVEEADLEALAAGTHDRLHEVLGAHPMTTDGQDGTYFAVWAPAARYVSVIGDFNHWDRRRCPLEPCKPGTSVWQGFVVGVGPGDLYKFHVSTDDFAIDKFDPMGGRFETPPHTASIVTGTAYAWNDGRWLRERSDLTGAPGAMSIYQVHLPSWMRVPEEGYRPLTYRELAPRLAEHVLRLGFTHVQLLPVMEHPDSAAWGYATTGYFAPAGRLGHPTGFAELVDHLHRKGIGVLLDWVPSHFSTQGADLAGFGGSEHTTACTGSAGDGPVAPFDLHRPEVRGFLLSSARMWLEHYHADGLRIGGIDRMLDLSAYGDEASHRNGHGGRENLDALKFVRELGELVAREFPGACIIASEATKWPMAARPSWVGGLGFTTAWDECWSSDVLNYFGCDPIRRKYVHHVLERSADPPSGHRRVLALSHDVAARASLLGRMPGDRWQQFANVRAMLGLTFAESGYKLLFMGNEFGQANPWNPHASLDWHLLGDPLHQGVQRWVGDLNRIYREQPALHGAPGEAKALDWIDLRDAEQSVIAFLRQRDGHAPVLVIANLTPVPRYDYRIGVPHDGFWAELLGSDAQIYGGSGVGNGGGVWAQPHPAHDRPASLMLTLPPLAVTLLRLQES